MTLIQVLCVVLTELSIGSLLITCLLSPREIRASFFTFISLLCALSSAIALVLSKWLLQSAWADVRYLGLTVIGATAAFGAFRLEKPNLGRLLLLLSGLMGFLLGVLPLARNSLTLRGIDTIAPGFFDAGVITGTVLMGAVTVTMILGHWYLVMRRLSFEHLLRCSQILLLALGLRIAVVVGTLLMLGNFDADLARTFLPSLWSIHGNLFFFLMRLLWGLALPAVLGVLELQCVQDKSNQSATGLLYLMTVSILFGELFAAYLLI
ncbi:MAG TPA: hypothetical protein VMP11_12210 [Verrucomicrobiae bacterium]|nr:hypothetical protein [Verrucomicrobiae bacterium]